MNNSKTTAILKKRKPAIFVCTGRLEVLLKDQTQFLTALKNFQRCIVEDLFEESVFRFEKIHELQKTHNSEISEEAHSQITLLAVLLHFEDEEIIQLLDENKWDSTDLKTLKRNIQFSFMLHKAGIDTFNDFLEISMIKFEKERKI